MNKPDNFKAELLHIKNERLRDNLSIIIDNLPDYFFTVPASSTGKYHPSFDLGEGGLIRHSKVAFRIGVELLNTKTFGDDFTADEKDLLLMSILVHDGLKMGKIEEKYTRFDHPVLMADYISEIKDKLTLSEDEIKFMHDAIISHMGEWNTSQYSKTILPTPETKYQKFVHLCDFIASRKFLDFNFKDNVLTDCEDC
jgi:hypothetical protein